MLFLFEVFVCFVVVVVVLLFGEKCAVGLRLDDGACKTVVFEQETTSTGLFTIGTPFTRQDTEINGHPEFLQMHPKSYQSRLLFDSKWVFTKFDRSAIIGFQITEGKDPTEKVEWAIATSELESNLSSIVHNLTLKCYECSLDEYEACREENMICVGDGGVATCVCDESFGLTKLPNNACAANLPNSFTLDGVDSDFQYSEGTYYQQNKGLFRYPTEWVSTTDVHLDFIFPGVWIMWIENLYFATTTSISINPSNITGFVGSSSRTALVFPFSVISSPIYCDPLKDCGENFRCIQDTFNAPVECVCDENYFSELQNNGECAIPSCERILITNLTDSFDVNGLYFKGNFTFSGFPVFVHPLLMYQETLSLYFLNGRWRLGDYKILDDLRLYGPYGVLNPTKITEFTRNGQTQFPIVRCQSLCDVSQCADSEVCIYSDTNKTSQEYACGCAPDSTLIDGECVVIDPQPTATSECKIVEFAFKNTKAILLSGLYIRADTDSRGYSVYQQLHQPYHSLYFNPQNLAWEISALFSGLIASCFVGDDPARDVSNLTCKWYVYALDSSIQVYSEAVSCVECTEAQSQVCEMQGKKCASGACVCSRNTVGDNCDPIDRSCNSVEFNSGYSPSISGAYYISGVHNNRPWYQSAGLRGLFIMLFDEENWLIQSLDTEELRAYLESDAVYPLNEMDMKWIVSTPFDVVRQDSTSLSTCSLCTPTWCKRDQICDSLNYGPTPVCRCFDGYFPTLEGGGCELHDTCDVLLFLNEEVVGYFNVTVPGGETEKRPQYSGVTHFSENGMPEDVVAEFFPEHHSWLVYPNETKPFIKDRVITFASDSLLLQTVATGFVSWPKSYQISLGEEITSFGFACDLCQQANTCSATANCVTMSNGAPSCTCDERFEEQIIRDNVLYCHHTSFSTSPDNIVLLPSVLRRGEYPDTFKKLYNSHVNDWFYYSINTELSTTQNKDTWIFFVPFFQTWAVGSPLKYNTATATTPSLFDASFPGERRAAPLCPNVPFSVQPLRTTSRMQFTFGNETVLDTEVRISTSDVFENAISYPIEEGIVVISLGPFVVPNTYYIRVGITKEDDCFLHPRFERTVVFSSLPPSVAPSLIVRSITSNSIALLVSMLSPLEANGAVVGYTLQYEKSGAVTSLFSSSSFVNINGLDSATSYTIIVAAHNSEGRGPFSNGTTLTTYEGVPANPTIQSISISNETQLIARLQLPPTQNRNGEVTDVKFVCNDADGVEVLSVTVPLENDNIYNLGVLQNPFEIRCRAAIRTSAGFGIFSRSTSVTIVSTSTARPTSSGALSPAASVGIVVAVLLVLVVLVVAIDFFVLLLLQ
eukprot:m.65756 g.65756  ORF g.65756 m.65756 type:complete len:1332 (-) comp11539_c0_seq1:593-4588(-)